MNSYISLETAAIFCQAEFFLQQGISSDYVMVDFICMGLLDIWAEQTDNYTMKKIRTRGLPLTNNL